MGGFLCGHSLRNLQADQAAAAHFGYCGAGQYCTILPVLTSIYIADEEAERRGQEDLQEFAEKAVIRTDLVTSLAIAAISDMQAAPGDPCSPAHIVQLARVLFKYRYIQDAGVYGGGQYLCSPLLGDVRSQHLAMPPPSWRSKDGYLIWFGQKTPLSDTRWDIRAGHNGYYVSIDPQSYADLIDLARRPIAAINLETNTILDLSSGTDSNDMLNAWKPAVHVTMQNLELRCCPFGDLTSRGGRQVSAS